MQRYEFLFTFQHFNYINRPELYGKSKKIPSLWEGRYGFATDFQADGVDFAMVKIARKAYVLLLAVRAGVVWRTLVVEADMGHLLAVGCLADAVFNKIEAVSSLACGLIAEVGVDVALRNPAADEFVFA